MEVCEDNNNGRYFRSENEECFFALPLAKKSRESDVIPLNLVTTNSLLRRRVYSIGSGQVKVVCTRKTNLRSLVLLCL